MGQQFPAGFSLNYQLANSEILTLADVFGRVRQFILLPRLWRRWKRFSAHDGSLLTGFTPAGSSNFVLARSRCLLSRLVSLIRHD